MQNNPLKILELGGMNNDILSDMAAINLLRIDKMNLQNGIFSWDIEESTIHARLEFVEKMIS